MRSAEHRLRLGIAGILEKLKGRPSRAAMIQGADDILALRLESGLAALWTAPPLMLTATLDDGLGNGLEVIHRYAEAFGMRLLPMGFLQTPEDIIAACREHTPCFLGLTILQFDTEEAVRRIRDDIPASVRILAGGPLFQADPELAGRAGVDVVLKNAPAFGEFLLNLPDSEFAA